MNEITAPTEKPKASIDLIQRLTTLKAALGIDPQVVYHPAGADEVAPSQVFPNARVIYADINGKDMETLSQAGYEAHHASATIPLDTLPAYTPDQPVDLLFLLNPAISHEIPAQSLREGGIIVANDYHHTASDLHEDQENYELLGIIIPDSTTDTGFRLDTTKPEDYWDRMISSDTEFKAARGGFGSISYQRAREIVKQLKNLSDEELENTNIFEAYTGILKETEAAVEQKNAALIAQNPDFADLVKHMYDEAFILEGGKIVLPRKLPNPKAIVDDLFVFRKR